MLGPRATAARAGPKCWRSGMAVRRHGAAHTLSLTLSPQAIIRDRDTFFDPSLHGAAKQLERQ